MKNLVIISSILLIPLISCKEEKKNKSKTIISNEVKVVTTIDENGIKKTDSIAKYSNTINGKTTKAESKVEKYQYVYKAFDGTEANVTFTNGTGEGNFILIERNQYKLELPQTQANDKMAVFEKDNVKAIAEGNKITITQDGKTFELERKK
jgi:hypothetical protein